MAYFGIELKCGFPVLKALWYNTPCQLRSKNPTAEEWKTFILNLGDYCESVYQCRLSPPGYPPHMTTIDKKDRSLWFTKDYAHAIRFDSKYSLWLEIEELRWKYDSEDDWTKCENIAELMAKIFEILHEMFAEPMYYNYPRHLQLSMTTHEEWLTFKEQFISYCLTKYPNLVYGTRLGPTLETSKYCVYIEHHKYISIYNKEILQNTVKFQMEYRWVLRRGHKTQTLDNIHEFMTLLFSEIHKAFTEGPS